MMQNDTPPMFTISLDFELAWGIFESDYVNNSTYLDNTLEVIPKMLNLFEEYGVRVTWATVGMLFLKDGRDWQKNIPDSVPIYENDEVSSYSWYTKNSSLIEDKYVFASDIINRIKNVSGQEIGTHTYSHYYCKEGGQTISDFAKDIERAQAIASISELKLESLVFPRNQFNNDYLNVCWENGIRCVRTNPNVWFWNIDGKKNRVKKVGRIIDSYIYSPRLSHFNILTIIRDKNKPLEIPASRLLRPHDKLSLLNKQKLNIIVREMISAAKANHCYHLWWHPHNFALNPEKSLTDLRYILDAYVMLKSKYGMKSMSMSDLYHFHQNVTL